MIFIYLLNIFIEYNIKIIINYICKISYKFVIKINDYLLSQHYNDPWFRIFCGYPWFLHICKTLKSNRGLIHFELVSGISILIYKVPDSLVIHVCIEISLWSLWYIDISLLFQSVTNLCHFFYIVDLWKAWYRLFRKGLFWSAVQREQGREFMAEHEKSNFPAVVGPSTFPVSTESQVFCPTTHAPARYN